MSSVKHLLAALGADDEITALRKAMASSMHRFQTHSEEEFDWAKWTTDQLTTSVKVSVVGNWYADTRVYELLLADDPTRVGINILASLKLSDADLVKLKRDVLERYFRVTKGKVLFLSPMTHEYGKVVSPYGVFTVLSFVPLEQQVKLSIDSGFTEGMESFLATSRAYFRLLNECLTIVNGRYGKNYIGAVVDDPFQETVSVLSPIAFAAFIEGEITIIDYLVEEADPEKASARGASGEHTNDVSDRADD